MADVVWCSAKSTRSGERCRKPVTPGATVCAAHGSRAPQVRAAAARRMEVARAEEVARREVGARQFSSIEDVYDELLKTAELTVEFRDRLEVIVGELREWRYTSVIGTEQLRSEVAAFERAMDRSARVLGLIAKLDIQGRRRRIAEAQGDLVVVALQRILEAMALAVVAGTSVTADELRPVWAAAVREIVPRELRAVTE